MKPLAVAALALACLSIPAYAQRHSFHSGGSGHAAQPGHVGAALRRPSGSAPFAAGSPFRASRRNFRSGQGSLRATSIHLAGHRHRRPYHPAYRTRLANPGLWSAPYFLAYPDFFASDNAVPTAIQASAPANSAPEEQESYLNPFSDPASAAVASAEPEVEDAVTLIFKDGRPPEQIHNYLLTRKTLYVGAPRHPEIPVDQLDMEATTKLNHEVGIDFHAPGIARE
jgi:hypothetical protein